MVCVSSFVNGSESKDKGSSVLWITNITLCEFIWNQKYVYGIILLENNFITPESCSALAIINLHMFKFVLKGRITESL